MLISEGYEWATHQPLIRLVMDSYHPGYVLELGTGKFSTPIFLEYNITFDCIDHNMCWKDYIEQEYKIKVKYHDLKEIIDEDTFSTITTDQVNQITKFYQDLVIPDINPKLLFVDNAMSCRTIAINTLRDKFDFIIYHDHDIGGIERNQYNKINREGFNSYAIETERTGACLMIRDNNIDQLTELIQPYIKAFIDLFTECKIMIFYGMDSR